MRRPSITALSALVVLMPLSLVAPTAVGVDDRATVSPVDTAALRLTGNAADRVAGTFSRGSSVVSFQASRTGPVSATASLTVNGTSISATRDLRSGRAAWSAGGASLKPDDRAVAEALSGTFNRTWVQTAAEQKSALGGHRDLIVRLAMLVAEAPLGVPLGPQLVPRPGERRLDKTIKMTGAPMVESCLSDVVATTTAGSGERRAAVAACQQSNEDGILYFGNCSTFGRYICHDANSHCFVCETINAGPASSGCLGECGSGCNGLDIYTYDCGDHDQCGRVHGGSTNPWDGECGDEYWEADDDFIWGWPNC